MATHSIKKSAFSWWKALERFGYLVKADPTDPYGTAKPPRRGPDQKVGGPAEPMGTGGEIERRQQQPTEPEVVLPGEGPTPDEQQRAIIEQRRAARQEQYPAESTVQYGKTPQRGRPFSVQPFPVEYEMAEPPTWGPLPPDEGEYFDVSPDVPPGGIPTESGTARREARERGRRLAGNPTMRGTPRRKKPYLGEELKPGQSLYPEEPSNLPPESPATRSVAGKEVPALPSIDQLERMGITLSAEDKMDIEDRVRKRVEAVAEDAAGAGERERTRQALSQAAGRATGADLRELGAKLDELKSHRDKPMSQSEIHSLRMELTKEALEEKVRKRGAEADLPNTFRENQIEIQLEKDRKRRIKERRGMEVLKDKLKRRLDKYRDKLPGDPNRWTSAQRSEWNRLNEAYQDVKEELRDLSQRPSERPSYEDEASTMSVPQKRAVAAKMVEGNKELEKKYKDAKFRRDKWGHDFSEYKKTVSTNRAERTPEENQKYDYLEKKWKMALQEEEGLTGKAVDVLDLYKSQALQQSDYAHLLKSDELVDPRDPSKGYKDKPIDEILEMFLERVPVYEWVVTGYEMVPTGKMTVNKQGEEVPEYKKVPLKEKRQALNAKGGKKTKWKYPLTEIKAQQRLSRSDENIRVRNNANYALNDLIAAFLDSNALEGAPPELKAKIQQQAKEMLNQNKELMSGEGGEYYKWNPKDPNAEKKGGVLLGTLLMKNAWKWMTKLVTIGKASGRKEPAVGQRLVGEGQTPTLPEGVAGPPTPDRGEELAPEGSTEAQEQKYSDKGKKGKRTGGLWSWQKASSEQARLAQIAMGYFWEYFFRPMGLMTQEHGQRYSTEGRGRERGVEGGLGAQRELRAVPGQPRYDPGASEGKTESAGGQSYMDIAKITSGKHKGEVMDFYHFIFAAASKAIGKAGDELTTKGRYTGGDWGLQSFADIVRRTETGEPLPPWVLKEMRGEQEVRGPEIDKILPGGYDELNERILIGLDEMSETKHYIHSSEENKIVPLIASLVFQRMVGEDKEAAQAMWFGRGMEKSGKVNMGQMASDAARVVLREDPQLESVPPEQRQLALQQLEKMANPNDTSDPTKNYRLRVGNLLEAIGHTEVAYAKKEKASLMITEGKEKQGEENAPYKGGPSKAERAADMRRVAEQKRQEAELLGVESRRKPPGLPRTTPAMDEEKKEKLIAEAERLERLADEATQGTRMLEAGAKLSEEAEAEIAKWKKLTKSPKSGTSSMYNRYLEWKEAEFERGLWRNRYNEEKSFPGGYRQKRILCPDGTPMSQNTRTCSGREGWLPWAGGEQQRLSNTLFPKRKSFYIRPSPFGRKRA